MLYLQLYAEASLAVVHFISLPLFAGEWLNSLIFHDNIKVNVLQLVDRQ